MHLDPTVLPGLRDDARQQLDEIVALRHALHRTPERGLDLPAARALVLDALADLVRPRHPLARAAPVPGNLVEHVPWRRAARTADRGRGPDDNQGFPVPTGKVKWYDADRGFGFIAAEDGSEVFLHASALPAGIGAPKPGIRVDFGVADGRRGPQALSVKLLDPVPSVARAARKPPEDMAVIVEDLIKVLDRTGNDLRRGRYPEKSRATQVAALLRAVADDMEA